MATCTEASVAYVWRDKWMDVRLIRYGEEIRKIDARYGNTRRGHRSSFCRPIGSKVATGARKRA